MFSSADFKELLADANWARQSLACRYFADTATQDPDLIGILIDRFLEEGPELAWELRPHTRLFPLTPEAFVRLTRFARNCQEQDREDAWEIIDHIPQGVAKLMSDAEIRGLAKAGLDPECIVRHFFRRDLEKMSPDELERLFDETAARTFADEGEKELALIDLAGLLGRCRHRLPETLARLLKRRDDPETLWILTFRLAEAGYVEAVPALLAEFAKPVRNEQDQDFLSSLAQQLVRFRDPRLPGLLEDQIGGFAEIARSCALDLAANLDAPESEPILLAAYNRVQAGLTVRQACARQFILKVSVPGLEHLLVKDAYRELGLTGEELELFRAALNLASRNLSLDAAGTMDLPRGFDTFLTKVEKREREELDEVGDEGWDENEEPFADEFGEDGMPLQLPPELENDEGDGTFRRDYPKVGRNDLCPCGSGKKFKKCCGQ